MKQRPSLMVRGYEVPNPYASVFVVHGILTLAPALGLACAQRYLGAGIAFALGMAFFHVRNLAVRAENRMGLHEPA